MVRYTPSGIQFSPNSMTAVHRSYPKAQLVQSYLRVLLGESWGRVYVWDPITRQDLSKYCKKESWAWLDAANSLGWGGTQI